MLVLLRGKSPEKMVQKSENVQRRQVGHILTEISGFGNCQNSNHTGRDKTAVLLQYLHKDFIQHMILHLHFQRKKKIPIDLSSLNTMY